MSISLTTHGYLWPRALTIRDPVEMMEVDVQSTDEFRAEVVVKEVLDVGLETGDSLDVEVVVKDGIDSVFDSGDLDTDL